MKQAGGRAARRLVVPRVHRDVQVEERVLDVRVWGSEERSLLEAQVCLSAESDQHLKPRARTSSLGEEGWVRSGPGAEPRVAPVVRGRGEVAGSGGRRESSRGDRVAPGWWSQQAHDARDPASQDKT